SVTAGVRAIASAFPVLKPSSVMLASSIIFALTWVNLRGIRESAHAVAIPVYAFIFFIIMLCCSGIFIGFTAPPVPREAFISDPVLDLAALLIILRAFAGGCTAMTGIEVIANAGSILKKPHDVFARRILMTLGVLLCFCFLSITLTVNHLALSPTQNESLISQMTRYIWGAGILHETVQLLTAIVLFLAANSAFAGFPKLAAILATDGWLPKQFAALGDRLVFSQGILWLALSAALLVFMFDADTHAFIPLYAVGVFTAFTLSQSGMVIYWWRGRAAYLKKMTTESPHLRNTSSHKKEMFGYIRRMMINGFGAIFTGLALIITFEAKFMEGAYIVMVVVPLLCYMFNGISKHYKKVNAELQVNALFIHKCKPELATTSNRTVIVPISKLHKGSLEAIAFARSLSQDVRIIIVDANSENLESMIRDIEALKWGVKCVAIKSPYREVIQPIVEYVLHVDMERGELAVLVLPELVPAKWYQNILHNQTSGRIAKLMSWNENIPNKARIVINVPFYLE
ncbi:MAG: APC family permease, partial [Alphaproteobacteria bacterium]|nr:APC family permease [Alphaproteobacteria bacterium]